MYDRDFAISCIESIRNGVMIKTVSEKTGVSKPTLHAWLRGNLPHERMFLTMKEYRQNYYQKNKTKFKKQGLKRRLGSDVGMEVLERDKHRCISCGKDKRIEIHHINGDKSLNTKDNLVSLCKQCHSCLHWVAWHPDLRNLLQKIN